MASPQSFRDHLALLSGIAWWFAFAGWHLYRAESAVGQSIWGAILIAPFAALGYVITRPPPAWAKDTHKVSFDAESFRVMIVLPRRKAVDVSFPWSSVTRVRFVPRGLFDSDELWLFGPSARKPFIKIPTEAAGGTEFLSELMSRDVLAAPHVVDMATKK